MPAGAALAAAVVGTPFVGAVLIAALRAAGWRRAPYAALALLTVVVTTSLLVWLWLSVARPLEWHTEWSGVLGISAGMYVDDLSLLLAVLVTGVAVLAFLFSAFYLPTELQGRQGRREHADYYGYLLLFTGAMLGLVFAGDLILLYVFWELTDVASFLLVGLNWRDPAARASAVKVLVVTALGGLAVLLGFVLLGSIAGSFWIPELTGALAGAPLSPALVVALLLLVVGAAAKSAQLPLHVWLPSAMQAPVPVNAFLDSAALLAAGIYLLARVQPLFAGSPLWSWLVGGVGFASMIVGGVLALRTTDLKFILAYSSVSLYGFMFALLGLGGSAVAAALFLLVHHGLLKSGLFFALGVVMYATRRRVAGDAGGLWKGLPLTFAAAGVLALSLGGVPPLAGFWAKEIFLKEIVEFGDPWLVGAAVAGSALTLAYLLRFLALLFFHGSVPPPRTPPRALLLAPGVLALLTLLSGLWPGWVAEALVEPAAAAVVGGAPELSLELEPDRALLLSLLALGLGSAGFLALRHWGRLRRGAPLPFWSLDGAYGRLTAGVERTATAVLHLQNGRLRRYLSITLVGLFALVALAVLVPLPREIALPTISGAAPFDRRAALLLPLVCAGTLLTFLVRRHLQMVLALGAVGYLLAGVFALGFAPNLGILQVHVETLITVLLVLALARIPNPLLQRMEEQSRNHRSAWHWLLAGVAGVLAAGVSWLAIEHLPAAPIAPWYNENAQALTDAHDVVTAVLVDFRALDTLGEILVFATAAMGVFAVAKLIRKEEG